ncbi:MAG TPA: hypothetical protein EYH31_09245 [Anaerolineae bacterium]|nr:hypothetical protein [Anaerolineae bacterium]
MKLCVRVYATIALSLTLALFILLPATPARADAKPPIAVDTTAPIRLQAFTFTPGKGPEPALPAGLARDVPGLTYDLKVAAANYNTAHVIGFQVRGGITTTLDVGLAPKGVLTGQVLDASNLAPVPHAWIVVAPLSSDSEETQRSAVTDTEGVFTLLLSSDIYTVTVGRYGFYNAVVADIVISDGLTTTHDLVLTPLPSGGTGTLAGQITDAETGMPLSRAWVQVSNSQSPAYQAVSNAFGYYGLDLTPGTYDLRIGAAAHADFTTTVVITADQTTQQDAALGPGGHVSSWDYACEGLPLVTNPGLTKCEIHVTDPMTVTDVTVDVAITQFFLPVLDIDLISPDGTTVRLYEGTQHSGSLDFYLSENYDRSRQPDVGSMDDFNGRPGSGMWTMQVYNNGDFAGQWTNYNLHLQGEMGTGGSGGVLRGQIVDGRDSSPLPDVHITAMAEDGSSWETTSDAGGHYALLLPEGRYTLTAQKRGFYVRQETFAMEGWDLGLGIWDLTWMDALPFTCPDTPIPVPDYNANGVTCQIQVPDFVIVHDVYTDLDIRTTYRGDLDVDLIAPDGTTVRLNKSGYDARQDIIGNFDQTMAPAEGSMSDFDGSLGQGTWTLKVVDQGPGDLATIQDWTLYLIGTVVPSGWLEGEVVDANDGSPLPGAELQARAVTLGYTQTARSDAGGHFVMQLGTDGYRLQALKTGYRAMSSAVVTVTADTTVTQDVMLGSPRIAVGPRALTTTAHLTDTMPVTITLRITNSGSAPLTWGTRVITQSHVPYSQFSIPNPQTSWPGPRGVGPEVYTRLAAAVAQVITETAATAPQTAASARIPIIVYLDPQVDLDALAMATASLPRPARKQALYQALVSVASESQKSLLNALAVWRKTGAVTDIRPYTIVNAIALRANRAVVDALAARPDVAWIAAPRRYRIQTLHPPLSPFHSPSSDPVEWNVARIGAPELWALGIDGTGVVVGGLDTGVYLQHEALVDNYRGNLGNGAFDHTYSFYDGVTDTTIEPWDDQGHGTHTLGTVVGRRDAEGTAIGVAPGARWIACKAFDSNGEATDVTILNCFDWLLAPGGDPTMAPDVVNNSWGYTEGDMTGLLPAVQAWRAAGIFPEFSSGNTSGVGTIYAPASYEEAFATGAVDNTDTLADFSSRGPSPLTDKIKPDVVAPGVNIRSAYNGTVCPPFYPGDGNYCTLSGTSMAGPHTAGCAALLLSAMPELTVPQIENVLRKTAVELGPTGPDMDYGYGRIDCYAAFQTLAAHVSWADIRPRNGTLAPGVSAMVTITLIPSNTIPSQGTPVAAGVYVHTLTLRLDNDDRTTPVVDVPITLRLFCSSSLDVDCDGKVDVADVQAVADLWSTDNPAGDVDGDGDVDIVDVQMVARHSLLVAGCS